jgi:aminocarboxymuconate-semialdehyde decarboxylase
MRHPGRTAKRSFRGAGRPVAILGCGWFAVEVQHGSDARNAAAVPVVDVHSHFMPLHLPDLGAHTGDPRWPALQVGDTKGQIVCGSETFRVVSRTLWDLDARLEALKESGRQTQVISPVPVTLAYWADPKLATAFARAQNERLSETVEAAGGALMALGGVPLQDVDASIGEMERLSSVLGLAGVEIGTEVDGRELDDQTLRPFFQAAEALDVAIFVHPNDGAGAVRRRGQPYEFGLGMLTDTALAATALVFGGVLEACPRLRIGLAHGCGSFPWTYPRLLKASSLLPSPPPPAHTDDLVRRLWVDSLVFDPLHLPLLFERFGSGHVMLGSDYPFYPASWGAPEAVVTEGVAHGFCTAAQAEGILGANALEFLAGIPIPQAL